MTTSTETTDERRRRLYVRPVSRVYALTESWTGDHTPITRDEAARIVLEHIEVRGWTEADQVPPRLASVDTAES